MNRTPPREVQEILRKEINFGCPVEGCGIPYLTWHHFDPPWREKQHQNSEGMIALCATDAGLADGGRWTKDQLREMKRNPYISQEQISEKYDYLRKNVVCIIGNVAYEVENILEINGERVIGFERDEDGYDRLNLLIRDVNGSPILVMENNSWTAFNRELFDLRCSAHGRELEVVSKDRQTDFFMRFDDYSLDTLRKRLVQCGSNPDIFISSMGSPKDVPVWTVKGKIRYGSVHLEIRDCEIEELTHKMKVGMNYVLRKRSAYSFEGGPECFRFAI